MTTLTPINTVRSPIILFSYRLIVVTITIRHPIILFSYRFLVT